ncbi:MAG: hypothetical protein CSYNP_03178 [Syntrophus sp. SKADARSKE-3]|nr:hypothetical protein [Syntrophus sp. SKADARSKE-3]
MKVSCKAALLSAFVFPGIGHLYLKRYWRGLVIIFLEFAGMGYLIWWGTVSALHRLEDVMANMQGVNAMNPQELSGLIGVQTLLASIPYYNAVLSFIIFFWAVAVIDAYRIGKQKEKI